MADLFVRRKILIIGRVTSLISAIIMLFSNLFLGFAIGFILSAWGYNLNSGSEEVLIYGQQFFSDIGYSRINISIIFLLNGIP